MDEFPCPCGADHSDHPMSQALVELLREKGANVEVKTPMGAWSVPRIFIAMHGLAAMELPALADKYGWVTVPG